MKTIKKIKGGRMRLLVLTAGLIVALSSSAFATFIQGTLTLDDATPPANPNIGDPNISFVVTGADDTNIQTEGYPGTTNYDGNLGGTQWYFESTVGNFNLTANPPSAFGIYFHSEERANFFGSYTGQYSGATISNVAVILANQDEFPLTPNVTVTTGREFVGFHLVPAAGADLDARYRIYRSQNERNRAYERIASNVGADGAWYRDENLDRRLTYHYVVVQENGAGFATFSPHSGRESKTPNEDEIDRAPDDPIWSTDPIVAGHLQLTLSWRANSEADLWYYEIQRDESTDGTNWTGNWTPIGADDGNALDHIVRGDRHYFSGGNPYTFTDTSVNWGSVYRYRLRAVDFSENRSTGWVVSPVDGVCFDSGANGRPSASIANFAPISADVGTRVGNIVYTSAIPAQIMLDVGGAENGFRSTQQAGIHQFRVFDVSLADPGYAPFSGYNYLADGMRNPSGQRINSLTQTGVTVALNTLTDNGPRTIRAWVRDNDDYSEGGHDFRAQNESLPAEVTAFYDTEAPAASAVVAAGGTVNAPTTISSDEVNVTWVYTDNSDSRQAGSNGTDQHYRRVWWAQMDNNWATDLAGPGEPDAWTGLGNSTASLTLTDPGLDSHPVNFEIRVRVMDPARNAPDTHVVGRVIMDKRPSEGRIVIVAQDQSTLYTQSPNVKLRITRSKREIVRFAVSNTPDIPADITNAAWQNWTDLSQDTITFPPADGEFWDLGTASPEDPPRYYIYLRLSDGGVNPPSNYVTGSIISGQVPAGSAGVVSDLRITSLGGGSVVLRWHTEGLPEDRTSEVYISARPTGPFVDLVTLDPDAAVIRPDNPSVDEWRYTDDESVTPRFYKIKISDNGPLSADTVGKIRYDFFTAGQARLGINSFTLPFRTDLADNAPSFSMRSLELAEEINAQAEVVVVEFIGSYNSRQQTSVGDTFLGRDADGNVVDVTPDPDFTFLSIIPGIGYQISILDRGEIVQGEAGNRNLPVWFVGQVSAGERVAYRPEVPTRDPNVAAGGGGGGGAGPTPPPQPSE